MIKRVLLVLLTFMMAILAALATANNSPGVNTISFDEPLILSISIGILGFLFMPPLLMSFFNHAIVKGINVIYQCFIAISFFGLIPIGFTISNGFWTITVSILGTISSIFCIIATLKNSPDKTAKC